MNTERVYIAGPITNNPNYYKVFENAEKALQEKGYTTINPAKLPMDAAEFKQSEFMRVCLVALSMCDTIALLPNWEDSKGAREELEYAIKHNMNIIT